MNFETINVVKELGKRIIHFRKAMGYTQAELCKQTGFCQGYISQIENGKVEPTLETLLILTAGLTITMETLFRDIKLYRDITKRQDHDVQ